MAGSSPPPLASLIDIASVAAASAEQTIKTKNVQSVEKPMSLKFRCPAELAGVLPVPVPASSGLPGWLKSMPPQAFNALNGRDENTVKRCPPFVDAMTQGFLIPLMCDLRFDKGEVTWDNELPPGGTLGFVRSPIGFHESSQVIGSPLFEPDRFLIKFHNLWTIEAPEGYSVLFTHPANRFDLPFTTITGLVDCDLYRDNWVHFPAHWHDIDFSGVLPQGTPIAQVVPVKRERWSAEIAPFTAEETQRVHDLSNAIERKSGVYRRDYRG